MAGCRKAVVNIPLCLAGLLLCLTAVSCHLCGGLYAKYTAAGAGEDSARVARFDVSQDGACFSEELLLETVPGTTERTITVENNSEVAVACTVTIRNTTQNIPFAFSVDGSVPVQDVCRVVCYLEPQSTRRIAIAAMWSEEGALAYMGMVDLIDLTIRTEQVD